MIWFTYLKNLLVPFVSIWSHVSLLFKMLVWFDFLPCPFCFYEEENAYFDKRRMRFLLFSVTLFIAFTKCSQWMVWVLSDEVPWVFQHTALCWVKEYFLTVTWALHMLYLICILNLPELYQPRERGRYLLSDRTVFIYIFLLLTGLMAQSLEWICGKKTTQLEWQIHVINFSGLELV